MNLENHKLVAEKIGLRRLFEVSIGRMKRQLEFCSMSLSAKEVVEGFKDIREEMEEAESLIKEYKQVDDQIRKEGIRIST